MARYSAGVLTGAGSTTLPIISLYGGTTVRVHIVEWGVFNTTANAVALRLVRLTTTGTQGAAIARSPNVFEDTAAIATAFTTHTVAPTLGADLGYRCVLGAAIGSGIIFTFPDPGISIPVVAAAGVGLIVENGTGQACQSYVAWTET